MQWKPETASARSNAIEDLRGVAIGPQSAAEPFVEVVADSQRRRLRRRGIDRTSHGPRRMGQEFPFASYLEMVSLGAGRSCAAQHYREDFLERLKLIPKTKSPITPTGELEGSPTLSEPIPIVEASASDSRAEDIGEADERRRSAATLSDQLDSGTIPRVLTRSGVDAVWRLEPSREGSSEKDAG